MTILITGITGYIGKSLLNEYINSNKKIVLTYRKNKLGADSSNLLWKKFDLYSNQKSAFNYLLKPKTLIHLAWDGLELRDYDSDIHINQVNYHLNFIESLIKGGLKNIIIIGTCLEYGEYSGEINENMEPNPNTKYGQAKNILRSKLESLKLQYNFNLAWLRLFYLYGGEKKTNNLWGNINIAVNSKKQYFQISKGLQLRDYLHIKDVASYIKILSLINKDLGVLNICSNDPISIKNLVNKWINDNNWKIKVESNALTMKKHEKKDFWGSNKKLKSILKYLQ